MVAIIKTVSFQGVDTVPVEVQVHLAPGQNAFNLVGLPDKSVAESRERVRAALSAVGLALPYDRITINLSPADLPKEGSHYDLPIALGLLVAMGGTATKYGGRAYCHWRAWSRRRAHWPIWPDAVRSAKPISRRRWYGAVTTCNNRIIKCFRGRNRQSPPCSRPRSRWPRCARFAPVAQGR